MPRRGWRDGWGTGGMTGAFLGAARREPFRCTARIVKLGRRLVYGVAESIGDAGRLLAHHSLTYARAPPEARPAYRPRRWRTSTPGHPPRSRPASPGGPPPL